MTDDKSQKPPESWLTDLALGETPAQQQEAWEKDLSSSDKAEMEDILAIKTMLREELRQEKMPGLRSRHVQAIHNQTVGTKKKSSISRYFFWIATPGLAAALGLIVFVNFQKSPTVFVSSEPESPSAKTALVEEKVTAPTKPKPRPKRSRQEPEEAFNTLAEGDLNSAPMDADTGTAPAQYGGDTSPAAAKSLGLAENKAPTKMELADSYGAAGRGGRARKAEPSVVATSGQRNQPKLRRMAVAPAREVTVSTVEASGGGSAEKITTQINARIQGFSECLRHVPMGGAVSVKLVINKDGQSSLESLSPESGGKACLQRLLKKYRWTKSRADNGKVAITFTKN